MTRTVLGLVTVVAVVSPGVVRARQSAPPPTMPAVVTTLPHPADSTPLLPPPPAIDAAIVQPVPVPAEAPLFCPLTAAKPGLFGSVELGFLFPHVTNGLSSPVTVQPFGVTDTVALPAAGLDAMVAPQITLGYRLRDDLGAILVSYRNLASEGRELVGNFDFTGDGAVFSRLDINTVDIAYSAHEHPLGALWAMRWEIGTKLSSIYFDSVGQGSALGRQVSDHFFGAGPKVALDLTRELPATGLAVYSRAEFADLLGRVTQRYSETVGDPWQPAGFGSVSQSGSQAVPVLALQAGLSWLSQGDGRYRLTAGYSFEHYWAVGKLGPNTRGDVMAQGLFLRAEVNY